MHKNESDLCSIKERVAALIDRYSEHVLVLNHINKEFFDNFNISSSLNFRDALAHYTTLYETDESDVAKQEEILIKDHLNRGYKDQIVYLLHYISIKLFLMLVPPRGEALVLRNSAHFRSIRKQYHIFKNFIMDIREFPEKYCFTDDDSGLKKVNEIIGKLNEILIENNLKKYFSLNRDVMDLTNKYKERRPSVG